MGLSEALSGFTQAYGEQQGNDDIVEPYAKLKNGLVKLGRKTPDFYVRILPTGDTFYKDFRTVSMVLDTSKGRSSMVFQSSSQNDPQDPLNQAIPRWGKRILTPYNRDGNSGRGYTTKFLLNVIPLVFKDNQYQEVRDEQGNYKVYVLSMSWTQFTQLEALAKNPANNPTSNQFYSQMAQQYGVKGTDDWSFMSPLIAYPVHMSGSLGKNNIFESNISLQSSNMLPPLDAGWEKSLEDLDYQATPSYQYKPKVVSWAVDKMDEALGLVTTSTTTFQGYVNTPPMANQLANQQNPYAQGTVSPAVNSQGNPTENSQNPWNVPAQGSAGIPNSNPNTTPAGVAPSPASLGFTTVSDKDNTPTANPVANTTPNKESLETSADPFANNGQTIDISEDDLPF